MQNNKLFVRNLSFRLTEGELSDLFAKHGDVVSAKIAMDRDSGRPRGFAFVEMGSESSAEDAIRSLDNTEFGGRTIYVQKSEARERRSSVGYGRN